LQLIELLQSASGWRDDKATIYVAQPWSCEADAIIVTPAPVTTDPIDRDATSYSYFLEALIARDFVEDYTATGEGASANDRQLCERVIRYAEDDA